MTPFHKILSSPSSLITSVGWAVQKSATKHLNALNNSSANIFGSNTQHNLSSRYNEDHNAKVIVVRHLNGKHYSQDLFADKVIGISMPLTVSIQGLNAACVAGNLMRENQMRMPDIDGSRDYFSRSDLFYMVDKGNSEKQVVGGVSHRMAVNRFNSVVIAQQQAALNCAVIETYLKYPSIRMLIFGAAMSKSAGSMWDSLGGRAMSVGYLNPLAATPGTEHLYGDVPAIIADMTKDFLTEKTRTKEDILEFVKDIAGGAEIARGAAMGSLIGTRGFAEKTPELTGFYTKQDILPATWFFTPEGLGGAVITRDRQIDKVLSHLLRQNITETELDSCLKEGRIRGKAYAKEAEEIGSEVSPKLSKIVIEETARNFE